MLLAKASIATPNKTLLRDRRNTKTIESGSESKSGARGAISPSSEMRKPKRKPGPRERPRPRPSPKV